MRHLVFFVISAGLLAACTPPARLQAVPDTITAAHAPELVPLQPLLARADSQSASDPAPELASRAGALRARAARLRGPLSQPRAPRAPALP